MKYNKIHLGELIQSFVRENNIKSADLARKVGKSRQNIYDLYKRDDIEVKLFLTISDVLRHNFIEDIYPQKTDLTIDDVFDTMKSLVKEKLKEDKF